MDDTVIEKKKSGKGIVLGIISVLIVALIGIGVYLYFSGPKTNIYLRLIDEFSGSYAKSLKMFNFNQKKEITYEVSANVKTTDRSLLDVAKIINKTKVKTKIQSDINNKKINANLELFYDNKSTIDGNLYINDKDIFLSSESIYDKLLKIPTDEYFDLEELWNMSRFDEYETVIKEMTNILKNNLKEEYFVTTNEKINVLGSEVNALKQTFTLTYKQLDELEEAIKQDMLKDDKLLNALGKVTGMTVDEVKETINSNDSEYNIEQETTHKDEDVVFSSELYVNKSTREIDYAKIKSGEATYEFVKSSTNKFDIKINEGKVGTLEVSNNETTLTFDSEILKATIELKKDSANISADINGTTMNIVMKNNDNNGNIEYKIKDESIDLELTINVNYSVKDINTLDSVNYSNYKELENLTQEDQNSILTKIYDNKALTDLIQEVLAQYQSSQNQINQYQSNQDLYYYGF